MVTIYQKNNQNIGLEDIREILKIIAEIISKPSDYIIKKIKINSTKSADIKYHNKQQQDHKNQAPSKIELYNTMDSLAESLKKNESFYDEYFDFCEIQDMIKYTLDRESSLIKDSDLEFILKLVKNFSDLINHKIDLIENEEFDDKKFESEYNSYLTGLNESKIYFFENVCDETLDDDLFIKYTNIIMG